MRSEYTYKLPRRKTPDRPIFWLPEMRSFQIMGMGRIKIAASLRILMMAPAMDHLL
jgi:hypothetical protein